MEKRVTLALILCTIFAFGYMALVRSLTPPPPPSEEPASQPSSDAPEESGETASQESLQPSPAAAQAGNGEESAASATEEPETGAGVPFEVETADSLATERVETDRFIAYFTNRGAVPEQVLLKGVTRDAGQDPAVEANLLRILEVDEPDKPPLLWSTPGGGADLGGLLWIPSPVVTEGDEQLLVYEVHPGDGTRIRKSFRLVEGQDHIVVRVEVFTESPEVASKKRRFAMGGAAGFVQEGYPGQDDETYAIAKFEGRRDLLVMRPRDLRGNSGPKTIAGDAEFVAVVSKYFASILEPVRLPGQVLETRIEAILYPELRDLYLESGRITVEEATARARTKLGARLEFFDPLPAPQRDPLVYEFRVYLGFKDAESLGREPYREFLPVLEVNSASTCGLGFIVLPIAALLMTALKGIYAVIGNYGWAIIALTFLVKILMFPLTKRQQVSMSRYQEKMRKYKPELDKIREKYKNNKQKMQQETMKFMKEHGVNPIPLGGCLPLFVTMPIFLGLFFILRTAPELRQAGFLFWIDDLSRPDRLIPVEDFHYNLLGCVPINGLNILPILMTVAWFLQQRMMPKPQDPQQRQSQQMMMFMPIMFGFFLYNYAAGLSLYWFTNSVLGIIEQKVIRKALHLPKPEDLDEKEKGEPPAPRRRKG
jgi:YidC/Oxa1 family membrane protein insertase